MSGKPSRITEQGRAVWLAARLWEFARADLRFPITLSADGGLMDGGHRLCKAWMLGHSEISAVQFAHDPEPDYILPVTT